jgi:MoxR-like ATPase
MTEALTIEQVGEHAERILDEVEKAVVGKRGPLETCLLAFLADGHVLLEDYPGLAKTLIARSFAQVCDMRFQRIQFTPDLMPSDVTGSAVYDQRAADFEFRPGPIFANLLLGDEINRAPPKTQAALLEAMQERQVTIESTTHLLEPPFLVIATQNPIEYEGTYPLPEAQLDRFMVRLGVGYPEREHEWRMLEGRLERGTYLPVGHELAQFFRDVNDHLKLVNEEVIALRDLLAIILQANMAVISVAQNEMGVRQTEATKQLTLVATIFLPLSFVAGFFGMNFGWLTDHITPLWAFLLYGVGSFAASLAALLFWFRRSGHLGRETRPSRDGAVTSLGG